jgi:tetratricopeptide (TPR) repeat protein
MKRFFYLISFILFYGMILFFVGCSNEEQTTVASAEELVSQGWKEYVAGNYKDAIGKYQEALAENPDVLDAYNGIGWAMARSGQVRDSIDSFRKAIEKDSLNADAHAGLAGVYFASNDYERAIASAKSALLLNPQYISHHDDINSYDVHVLMAECYYISGNYSEALGQISLIGGGIGKNLDPSSPTYQGDLISVIDELAKNGTLTSLGFIKKGT